LINSNYSKEDKSLLFFEVLTLLEKTHFFPEEFFYIYLYLP